jgi:hypothetical protein
MQNDGVMVGSADVDNVNNGWLVGNYPAFPGLRRTELVQVKWGEHTDKDDSPGFKFESGPVVTLGILIRGKLRIEFERHGSDVAVDPVELSSRGQFAIWREDKLKHKNSFFGPTTVLTVRWKEPEKSADSGPTNAPSQADAKDRVG